MPNPKRKRVVLTIKEKLEILNRLKKGESGRSLSEKYGVGTSTISEIKKQSESLLTFASKLDSDEGCSKRKVMRKPMNETLEEAVFTWFVQKRSSGQPISGPLLCEKALDFNQRLGGDPNFSASAGWLGNFKARHGICQLDIHGEKLSANSSSASSFVTKFSQVLAEGGYDLDLVYNADETGLCWKCLPSKTLASRREQSAPGYKVSKDRVTLMTCANATGTHRIPMLLIGKSNRCLKNIKIPLIYKNQSRAWMNSDVFLDWYDNTFIPEVNKFREQICKENEPVLLILDNAPSHPNTDTLEREGFKVEFLPPSVTSILQPMDQSVIETMKRLYRKQLLRRLLANDHDDADSVCNFFKSINLKDCCYMVVEAWNSVSSSTLKKAWNKLLKNEEHNSPVELNDEPEIVESVTEVIKAIGTLNITGESDREDVTNWLNCDANNNGLQILTDDEIVESCLKRNDEEEDVDNIVPEPAGPSHAEAIKAANILFQWFEKQEEAEAVQLLQLQRIRDLALTKKNDEH